MKVMDLSFYEELLSDPCGGLVAAVIILFIGNGAVSRNERLQRAGAALGGIVFLAVFIRGVSVRGQPQEFAVMSMIWAGVTIGASWIILPIVAAVLYATIVAPWRALCDAHGRRSERREWKKRERHERLEAERRHEETMARIAAERKAAPPATARTRAEHFSDAKRRYDDMIRDLESAGLNELELNAARERARQQYLTELDRGMQ